MDPLYIGAAVMVTIPFSNMNEALSSIPSYFISKRIYMYIDIIVTFLKERCIICPPFSLVSASHRGREV